jgi:putative intracellular protease/amidase/uncharacterized protein YciI
MARIHVFLHDTYADWELGYVLPELARSGHEVVTFALSAAPVRSLGALRVTPEAEIDRVHDPELLILPGGLFWPALDDARLDALVRRCRARRAPVAAICAATGYLAKLGLLDDVDHTSNSLEFLQQRAPAYRGAARYRRVAAVSDAKLITAGGLGAVDFSYEILKALGYPELESWYRAFKHGEEPGSSDQRFAILLSKVPGRAASRETILRHVEHIRALDERGLLVLCGPFLDSGPRVEDAAASGLVVLKARDRDEATQLAEADPFVLEGVRTFEVRTWLLGHRRNRYLAD